MSAEILLRGNLRVIGSFCVGPDCPAIKYHASFQKTEDEIVCRIDAVDELETILIPESRVFEFQCASAVANNAAFEGAIFECIAIQINELVGEEMIRVIHR
jgi:hypothetical protein